MHLTVAQAFPAVITLAVGSFMVRLAALKGAVKIRQPDRCASCGRRRDGSPCRCRS
jgi:hypothetical protein